MVARTDPAEPDRAVIEAAAFWQAQLADEESDEESRSDFHRWLQADRSHKIAFDRMSAISEKIVSQGSIERTALGMMLKPERGRRASMFLILIGTATMLTWVGAREPTIRSPMADEQTQVGQQHRMTMASGDKLVLDSDTAADVDDADRVISLWRGGIMAHVVKDNARPFVVRTPQGTARALGTQFSVRVQGDVTTVSVIESRVEACARAADRACVMLAAGQSARIDARGVSRVADIDPSSEKAWSDGLLVVDDRPLTEVIDRLNRYRRNPIGYSGADLREIRVSGTFPLTNTDRALASLQAALPIVVDRGDRGVSIRFR